MLDWSKFDLSDPGWAAVCLTLVGAGCVAAFKLVPWMYKYTAYRHHNFKINILNRVPTGSQHPIPTIPEPESLKILGIGYQRLFVEVKATCRFKPGFQIKSINFRFLKPDEVGTGLPVKGGLPIAKVLDHDNSGIFRMSDDNYNGTDGEYTDIRGLGQNRCLYFEIFVHAVEEWRGYISFKARDSSGFCSYARYAVEVQSFPTPYDYELENIDMMEAADEEKKMLS